MTSGAVQVGDEPDTAVPQADSKSLPLEQSEVVALCCSQAYSFPGLRRVALGAPRLKSR